MFGRNKILELEKQLENARLVGVARNFVVSSYINFLESMGETDRKNYVAKVSGWFPVDLRPHLQSMIYEQQKELARLDMGLEATTVLRSNINCLYLLIEWGDRMIAEYRGNIEEARRRSDSDQNIISNIKEKYNV